MVIFWEFLPLDNVRLLYIALWEFLFIYLLYIMTYLILTCCLSTRSSWSCAHIWLWQHLVSSYTITSSFVKWTNFLLQNEKSNHKSMRCEQQNINRLNITNTKTRNRILPISNSLNLVHQPFNYTYLFFTNKILTISNSLNLSHFMIQIKHTYLIVCTTKSFQ